MNGAAVEGIDAALAAGGTISGTVSGEPGAQPLEGIEVCAFSTSEEAFWNCAQSEANGEYAIGGLAAGTYKVVFLPEESAYSYVFQYYDDQYSFAAAKPVPVSTGGVETGIDAELSPGGSIAGLVTDATSHAPLGEIAVCAFELSTEFVSCAWTDPGGRYLIQQLPYGSFMVVFAPFGEVVAGPEAEYLTQYYDGQSNPAAATEIAFTKSEVRSGVDAALTLRHPAPPAATVPPVLPPAALPVPPRRPHRHAHKCRRGFRKKRSAKGRVHCVRVRHKKHRHRRHHHGSNAHPRVRHHRLDEARLLAKLP